MSDLREALTTALTVALHETFDPECSGEPPYDSSQRIAAEVMAMPVVRAALAASPTPDALDVEALAEAIFNANHYPDTAKWRRTFRHDADAIAAEYAAILAAGGQQ